jgi:ABC-type glycerol-3-phosphate transport system permease component
MRASRRFSITAYTILTFFAILELFPLVLLLIMSVKSQNQIIANPLVPSAPFYFDNYLVAWESIKQYMLNTVIMAIANLVGGLTISAVAAYVFARYKFPGRNLLFGLVLALIMIPGITSLIPRFILIRDLGLLILCGRLSYRVFWAAMLSLLLCCGRFSSRFRKNCLRQPGWMAQDILRFFPAWSCRFRGLC